MYDKLDVGIVVLGLHRVEEGGVLGLDHLLEGRLGQLEGCEGRAATSCLLASHKASLASPPPPPRGDTWPSLLHLPVATRGSWTFEDFVAAWIEKSQACPPGAVADHLKSELNRFRDVAPALKHVRGDSFQPEHWRSLFGKLKIEKMLKASGVELKGDELDHRKKEVEAKKAAEREARGEKLHHERFICTSTHGPRAHCSAYLAKSTRRPSSPSSSACTIIQALARCSSSSATLSRC